MWTVTCREGCPAVVIGVTGGIATGKSVVARMFADLGAELISADDIAREVLAHFSPILACVIERFGKDLLLPNGDLDRSRLAAIIFSDPQARDDLNAITHPAIIAGMREGIERFRHSPGAGRQILIAEIPLLFECQLRTVVDKVVVVAAEQRTEERRLMNRDRMNREQALARISSQMPLREKIALADWVVWTDDDLPETERQVRQIWAQAQAQLSVES